jgi:predicted phosphodiesterase
MGATLRRHTRPSYKVSLMPSTALGNGITGTFTVPTAAGPATAQVFEGGISLTAPVGEIVVAFRFPMIGRPVIASGAPTAATVLEAGAITFDIKGWRLEDAVAAIRAVFADRMSLLPTGGSTIPVPFSLGTPQKVVAASAGVQAVYGIDATAPLGERQLYDVGGRRDDGTWHVVAPHAVYYRSAWKDFGIAQITDIHVARRNDVFVTRLENAGRQEAAARMVNFNDRFRGFIKYANYLHASGKLDVILATGDVVDYMFENGDDEREGGNMQFVRELLLGRSAGRFVPEVEELKVPIFMVPGNHDYRKHRYPLVSDLDFGLITAKRVAQYGSFRLTENEALVAQGRFIGEVPLTDEQLAVITDNLDIDFVPDLSAETLATAVAYDSDNLPWKNYIADLRDYVVNLGDHRIVMLDSAWDVGLPTSKVELVQYALGGLPEDKRTAIGGSPNSRGPEAFGLKTAVDTLNSMPPNGLFVLGLHAPLINPWGEEYPFFLRESQRRANADRVLSWLARQDPATVRGQFPDELLAKVRPAHREWFAPAGDPDAVSYLKRGGSADLLDYGVVRSGGPDLFRALAGIGQQRKADVVLHGHIHRYAEFRVAAEGGDTAVYMDFYTQNIGEYYPQHVVDGWLPQAIGPVPNIVPTTELARTYQSPDAFAGSDPVRLPFKSDEGSLATAIPPYAQPLSAAQDHKSWWDAHRPLVLLTEALGPYKNATAELNGFRLLTVKNDVITRIDFASMEALHEARYVMPWEQLVAGHPFRQPSHAQRSAEFGYPKAAGSPVAFLHPANNAEVAVYRDEHGRLLEVWRDASGQRGVGNLTESGGNHPLAAGDPSAYFDLGASQAVIPYRGQDGHVHSLYWSTGSVGHDALSQPIGAPAATHDPCGVYDVATGLHHVVYRSGDGQLQALYWKGQDAAQREVLTAGAGFPRSAGRPSVFLDTISKHRMVVFRDTDGHIQNVYWADGPFQHENLSSVAGAPKAAGDPIAYFIQGLNLHCVFYRGVDKHVHYLWWTGNEPVQHTDLTTLAGAPDTADDPASWFSGNGQRHHVVFRCEYEQLHDIAFGAMAGADAPQSVNLTREALAIGARGRPTGFSDATHHHVIFRGTDDQIHELRWPELASGAGTSGTPHPPFRLPRKAPRGPGGGVVVR